MSTLRGLSRNISWNYVEAGVSLLLTFVLTPIVLEHLGAVGYGVWVLINAILFYLRFLDLGFYNALVKYIAEYAERQEWPTINGFIATTTSVLAVAGVAAFLVSAAIAWLIVPTQFHVPPERIPELQLATFLLGVDLLIAFPASVLNAIFEGRHRFDVLSGVMIVASILASLATVLVLELGYGIIALVWIEIAGSLFTTVLFVLFLHRLFPEFQVRLGRIGGPSLRRIRGYSTWTSLNEMLTEGGAEVEKLLIPMLLSVSLLTPYTLICKVAAGVFLAVEPITHVFFPLASAYGATQDKTRLREVLIRGTKLVMAVSLPMAVAIGFYGDAFLSAWVGQEHVAVPAGVMPLVVSSFLVTAFIMTAVTILLALARVKQVFWMGIAELALAILFVFIVVPKLGLVGLAGSLMAANVLVTFGWIVPYACRMLGQNPASFLAQSLLRPLLAALPMALFVLWLDQQLAGTSLLWLVTKAGLAGCVYLVAFYAVSLTTEERVLCYSSVRSMLGKKP